jgi:hypothetical protein
MLLEKNAKVCDEGLPKELQYNFTSCALFQKG